MVRRPKKRNRLTAYEKRRQAALKEIQASLQAQGVHHLGDLEAYREAQMQKWIQSGYRPSIQVIEGGFE